MAHTSRAEHQTSSAVSHAERKSALLKVLIVIETPLLTLLRSCIRFPPCRPEVYGPPWRSPGMLWSVSTTNNIPPHKVLFLAIPVCSVIRQRNHPSEARLVGVAGVVSKAGRRLRAAVIHQPRNWVWRVWGGSSARDPAPPPSSSSFPPPPSPASG